MTDVVADRTNPATKLDYGSPVDETQVSSDLLAEHAGFLRNHARLLSQDIQGVEASIASFHRSALEPVIAARALEVAKRSVPDLLAELADFGFSWRSIAELCDVSVPALRKWRLGSSEPTSENRMRLSQLLSVAEILVEEHLISDVAAWLELPLDRRSDITGLQLLRRRRDACVIELAGRHRTPEEILDETDPGWRKRSHLFEVAESPEGEPVIRPVDQA